MPNIRILLQNSLHTVGAHCGLIRAIDAFTHASWPFFIDTGTGSRSSGLWLQDGTGMIGEKRLLGVMTMAYQDYFFVERWYRYWSAQIGPECLYLLSHGNDPVHREIAIGANIINLPRDSGMYKFDARRWRSMGYLASGLLEFYKWMIVSDVDEIVIADPLSATSVGDWIERNTSDNKSAPKNISPLCLELIHLPDEEPESIADDATILSRRRIFQPNWNYSKPCLIGAPALFAPGGHRNNLGPRLLPDGLFTLHLKFFDLPMLTDRSKGRKEIMSEASTNGLEVDTSTSWGSTTLDRYHNIVASKTLRGEDVDLPEYRAAMRKQKQKYTNSFIWGQAIDKNLYRIPERFSALF
ncbi:hypothetical protein HOY34_02045 [Xinfangfangia sp. D13-10-4-6]|uniref:glycosyltransferase family 2 protein n=1 Tax=Pseudogemmobacter hezensis TaxID=2737662 RepID=UPI001553CCB7|nr:glycosyltransferase family 2 protein [Pseudogemmobacter hezensis]NPD13977.1 hypothetical protein [Pseudogemmobacter hezensis]